jgi:hypothetical protein
MKLQKAKFYFVCLFYTDDSRTGVQRDLVLPATEQKSQSTLVPQYAAIFVLYVNYCGTAVLRYYG